jgi:hypothetical protein
MAYMNLVQCSRTGIMLDGDLLSLSMELVPTWLVPTKLQLSLLLCM